VVAGFAALKEINLSSSTVAIILLFLIMAILLLTAFWGTTYLVRSATRSIIRSLREKGAVSPASAITAEKAGIKPRSLFKPGLLRDYKPAALQHLIKNNIIRRTEEEKIYLSEETLIQSGFDHRIG
jgi:hypothetical protein